MATIPKNENVRYVVRKHWFLVTIRLVSAMVVYLAPIAAYRTVVDAGLLAGGPLANTLPLTGPWELFLLSSWSAVWWAVAFGIWTDYYLDMWVVTDRRIIDVEQRGFFNREISSFRLDRIQDVTTEVRGIVATLLDYGTVHVQTAGERRRMTLPGAPRPAAFKEYILARHNEAIERRQSPDPLA